MKERDNWGKRSTAESPDPEGFSNWALIRAG